MSFINTTLSSIGGNSAKHGCSCCEDMVSWLQKDSMCWVMICLLLLLSTACESKNHNTVKLNVAFQWNRPCTPLDRSPQIILDQIPAGTARWYVELIDLDLPSFDHGSGFALLGEGKTIPAGAVVGSYKGPSPPYGVIHDYEIVVMARDDDNRTIGIGKSSRRYPPEGEEEERWSPCN